MENPVLSVSMITYNHEKYLRQCLESVVSQKTDFIFEVIIGEDCSTDNTRAIVREFEDRYPKLIKPIYHARNVGMIRNGFEFCFAACKGKYVACLEGDDYWTDPYKLQKQVDFLEANPNYSMCFHNAKVIFESGKKPPYFFNLPNQKETLNFEDLSERWQIATASMVFRSNFLSIPSWFYTIYNCDMAMQFLLIDHGPFKYIDHVMSVYRRHEKGISDMTVTSHLNNITSIIQLTDLLDQHFNQKYIEPLAKLRQHLYSLITRAKIKSKYPYIYQFRNFIKSKLTTMLDKI